MRYCLLLLAGARVVGCARWDGKPNNPAPEGTRALAEESGHGDFNDINNLNGARTFSERPGTEPIALLRGRTVILRPSRVAFQIPQAWLEHYDSPPKDPFEELLPSKKDPDGAARGGAARDNLHFTRQELNRLKNPEGDEWDQTFAEVVDHLLPFEKCVFHGGGEGWGRQAHSGADLQMRVYVGNWDLADVKKLVGERGLPAMKRLSNWPVIRIDGRDQAPPPVTWDRTTIAGWQVESLTLPMWFYDFGAIMFLDLYARKYPKTTAILVFMYSKFPINDPEEEIRDIVHSFRIIKGG